MSPRLLKPPPARRDQLAVDSTQVYTWPPLVRRLAWAAPTASALFLGAAFYFSVAAFRAASFDMLAVAMLALITSAGLFVCVGVLHATAAREARFTRDRLILRQTGREPLVLPYATYQREWVADFGSDNLIRLIVFGHNRGGMILLPPAWVRIAFEEIARIQNAEGWYEPRDE